MSKLRNILIGAGVAAVGAIGTKKAVDYMLGLWTKRGKRSRLVFANFFSIISC